MDCMAWKIPEGCYAAALYPEGGCGSANWFWWLLAGAGALLLVGRGKRKSAGPVRQVRVRARR
jgi:hypothetical protein